MSVKYEVVSMATPFSELLKWDRDREKKVRFVSEPDQFKELDEDEVRKLSAQAKEAYFVAREEHSEKTAGLSDEEERLAAQIKAGYQSGNAKKRLEILNPRQGFTYQWIRPDMVDTYMRDFGYAIVANGPERTMANPTGKGPHVISRNGQDELALVIVSHKLANVRKDAKREKNRKLREAVNDSGMAAVEKEGVRAIDEGYRGDFNPITER